MKMHLHQWTRPTLVLCWLIASVFPAAALAQESTKIRTPTPRENPQDASISPRPTGDPSARVYPGDMAPDFELDSSRGRPIKLSGLHGDWIALIFTDRVDPILSYKSIDMDMRRLGARVVAVCREKANRVIGVAQKNQLPFLVLADATGQVGTLYGLRDFAESETRPAFLLLDRRGVVKLTVLGRMMTPEMILELTRETIVGT